DRHLRGDAPRSAGEQNHRVLIDHLLRGALIERGCRQYRLAALAVSIADLDQAVGRLELGPQLRGQQLDRSGGEINRLDPGAWSLIRERLEKTVDRCRVGRVRRE